MKYTVLLLRPDYIADTFGQDTYMDHVEATTPAGAVDETRTRAIALDYGEDKDEAIPEAYFVLAVFAGHHDDVAPEES